MKKKSLKQVRSALYFAVFAVVVVLTGGVFLIINHDISTNPQAAIWNEVETFNRCDLNRDKSVNRLDVDIAAESFGEVKDEKGQEADVNENDLVNSQDFLLIEKKDPRYCYGPIGTPTPVYNRCDFNTDGVVDDKDQKEMGSNYFTKDPVLIAKYDINGDKKLNSGDQAVLAGYIKQKTSRFCIDIPTVNQ